MSLKYLNLSGLEDLWINIKNYILSKVPTKTSELTNDSGYLTSHQSLDNYVTLNSNQTITAIKTITGGNQGKMLFKNPNYTKGDAVESGTTISRLYFGNGASYATANGILTFDITSSGNTSLELAALNNTASNSYRASLIITYDKSATRPRLLKSWGDFIPYINNGYSLGNASSIWKECYSNAYYLGSTAFGDIVTHNASEFLTSHQSLDNYSTKANTVQSLSISGTTITYTMGDNSIGTLTTQDTVYTHPTTAGNKHIPSGGDSNQYLKWSSDGTAEWSALPAFLTEHQTVTNQAVTLAWNTTSTVATIGNTDITVKMPANPNSDKKVYQYYKSDDNVYRLLFSNNAGNTATSDVGAVYSGLNNSFYVNPSTGSLYATKLYSGGTEVSVSGHTHTVSDITGVKTCSTTQSIDSFFVGTYTFNTVANAPFYLIGSITLKRGYAQTITITVTSGGVGTPSMSISHVATSTSDKTASIYIANFAINTTVTVTFTRANDSSTNMPSAFNLSLYQ